MAHKRYFRDVRALKDFLGTIRYLLRERGIKARIEDINHINVLFNIEGVRLGHSWRIHVSVRPDCIINSINRVLQEADFQALVKKEEIEYAARA